MLFVDMVNEKYVYNEYTYNSIIIDDDTDSFKSNGNISGVFVNMIGVYIDVRFKLYKVKVKELFNFSLIDKIKYYRYKDKEMLVLQLYGDVIYQPFSVNRYFGNKFILSDYRLYQINNFNFSDFTKDSKYNEVIRGLRGY